MSNIFSHTIKGGLTVFGATVAFAIVSYSTLQASVVDGHPRVLSAERNITVAQNIQAPRGLFLSQDGTVLVRNDVRYDIYLLEEEAKRLLTDTVAWRILTDYIEIDANSIEHTKSSNGQTLLARAVPGSTLVALRDGITGYQFIAQERVVRNYKYPQQYAHIVGYTGIASPTDVENGYKANDTLGKYRLEQLLDSELRGVPGVEREVGGATIYQSAVPGHNVVLTIDHDWQQALYTAVAAQARAVNAYAGAAVVMEADTGAIKAYASYPSFNSNLFTLGGEGKQLQALQSDSRTPLVDKVVGLQAPPGSTFKVISAYTALSKKVITPASRFVSRGCMQLGNTTFCEFGKRALGVLNVVEALTRSSNTFFCNALIDVASTNEGLSSWVKIMQKFGVGQKTGIDLGGEVAGVLPSPSYKRQVFKDRWYGGDTCNTAIGQGFVSVTPMQMALVAAAFANGGEVFTPHVIDKVVDQQGNVIKQTAPQKKQTIPFTSEMLGAITAGMHGVAHNYGGSAYSYLRDVPGNFHVKTGSADAVSVIGGKKRQGVHGWVIGWFTYQDKRYAFAVHLHFGGGSWNAGPIIRGFANCLHANFPSTCRP